MKTSKMIKTMMTAAHKLEAANRLDLREPTEISVNAFKEVLSYTKALTVMYQTLHWISKGPDSYGDHLLFERLYIETNNELDLIAEKGIGHTNNEDIVETLFLMRKAATYVEMIKGSDGKFDTCCIDRMIIGEKHFMMKLVPKFLVEMENAGELSDGVENFLQGLIDDHGKRVYLLQQRMKKTPTKEVVPTGPVPSQPQQQAATPEVKTPEVSEQNVLENIQDKL